MRREALPSTLMGESVAFRRKTCRPGHRVAPLPRHARVRAGDVARSQRGRSVREKGPPPTGQPSHVAEVEAVIRLVPLQQLQGKQADAVYVAWRAVSPRILQQLLRSHPVRAGFPPARRPRGRRG